MIAVLRGFLWLTGVWLAVAVALVVGTLASVLTTLLLLRRCSAIRWRWPGRWAPAPRCWPRWRPSR